MDELCDLSRTEMRQTKFYEQLWFVIEQKISRD